MSKRLLLILLVSFFQLTIVAQNETEIICKVIDKDNNYSVPYATIRIQGKNNGVIANLEGDFRLPIAYKNDNQKIIISSIGYENLTLDLANLDINKVNIIYLKPKVELLDQVILEATKKITTNELSPYSIVKNAIAKIPQNNPLLPYSTIGYYRDYQIVNDAYYNLNEAIIESYDAGFNTDIIMDKSNQNVLYSYRENSEFTRDSLLLLPYDGEKKYIKNTDLSDQGGNELGILNLHNPIRNYEYLSFSFVYVFKRKFLDNHVLTNIKKVFLNNELIYEISFKANKSLTKASHLASGKIFIGSKDFEIHKFNYSVFEINNTKPLFEVQLEYKKKNDSMYLNYITFNNQFVINDDFRFDITDVSFDLGDKSIYVTFNSDVDKNTLDTKDFKFRLGRKRLLVDTVELVETNIVKVTIKEWSLPEIDDSTDMTKFTHRIKNIYDVTNRKLYDTPKVVGYQFREYFVQNIFENKALPRNINYIDKFRPLSVAQPIDQNALNDYWLNTPLKKESKKTLPTYTN